MSFSTKNIKHPYFIATPFGQVPVLYVDGDKFVLPESFAIYRYLAAKHGAIADSLEDQALCDAYGEHVRDYRSKITVFMNAKFAKKPDELTNEYLADATNYLHERLIPDLKKQLEKNETGWVVGDKPTWLDFYVADVIDNHLHWRDEKEKEIPEVLLQHRDKVFGLPGLEKRIEERKYLFPTADTLK